MLINQWFVSEKKKKFHYSKFLQQYNYLPHIFFTHFFIIYDMLLALIILIPLIFGLEAVYAFFYHLYKVKVTKALDINFLPPWPLSLASVDEPCVTRTFLLVEGFYLVGTVTEGMLSRHLYLPVICVCAFVFLFLCMTLHNLYFYVLNDNILTYICLLLFLPCSR